MKLFLFDLDGTLISTGGAGLRAIEQTFSERYSVSHVTQIVNPGGKTDPAIFREILQTYLSRSPRKGELEEIAETYLKFLHVEMQITPHLMVFPFVEEVLGYLSTQPEVSIGLGTGNLERGARIKLEPTGLNPFFLFGGFGSDSEDRAELLRTGHRRAEGLRNDTIPSSQVFVVGDTLLDIQAARRAGFNAIAVATGSVSFDELQKGTPDYVFHDLSEGWELIQSL